jgi:hypothetical protein
MIGIMPPEGKKFFLVIAVVVIRKRLQELRSRFWFEMNY